jgi:hypothetical protein
MMLEVSFWEIFIKKKIGFGYGEVLGGIRM